MHPAGLSDRAQVESPWMRGNRRHRNGGIIEAITDGVVYCTHPDRWDAFA